MKSIKSNFGLAAALFLPTLFTQLSFLAGRSFSTGAFLSG
jgi:hypothetical protein